MTDEILRSDGSINAKALFGKIIEATAMPQSDLEDEIRAKAKELSALRAEIRRWVIEVLD